MIIVGEQPAGPIEEFEAFAGSQHCSIKRLKDGFSDIPENEKLIKGIIVFEENSQLLPAQIVHIRKRTRYLDVPLVAVTDVNGLTPEVKASLIDTCSLCELKASAAEIFIEVVRRCDHEPILVEMRKEMLEPFTSKLSSALLEMAGVPVVLRSSYRKTGYKMFGDISAVIGLTSLSNARSRGSMVLSFPESTAAKFTQKIMAEYGLNDYSDDLVRDCVGEIANTVVGHVRGVMTGSNHRFAMGTPTIVSGTNHEIRHQPGMPCLVAAYHSEFGEFALQLCLNW